MFICVINLQVDSMESRAPNRCSSNAISGQCGIRTVDRVGNRLGNPCYRLPIGALPPMVFLAMPDWLTQLGQCRPVSIFSIPSSPAFADYPIECRNPHPRLLGLDWFTDFIHWPRSLLALELQSHLASLKECSETVQLRVYH